MSSSDSLFLTLPLRLQHLIDEVFDLTPDPDYAKAKTIPQPNPIGTGGFLVESHLKTSHEGGILERRTTISLSSIPSALQLFDLPPDDPEVLSVFKNAASGWTSGSMMSLEGVDPREKYVSREDWRSVCAVLLEHRNGGISDKRFPRLSKSGNCQDIELDSEDYIEPEFSSYSEASSSSEYTEHHTNHRKKVQDKNRQFTSGPARPSLGLELEHLSSRQRELCLKTFALFFPEVPHHKLVDHKIMIKDLERVSKLLGETIKAEEMIEMLNTFSTSPDKSLSFNDFGRIMIVAKLA